MAYSTLVYNNSLNITNTLIANSSNDTMYGTTSVGGQYGGGVIFSFPVGGSTPTILYNFSITGSTDPTNNIVLGTTPNGPLAISSDNSTLYGTTTGGGANSLGVIFSFVISSGTYNVLFDFNNLTSSASNAIGNTPVGGLILVGIILYGTTTLSTSGGRGSIFSYTIGGTVAILFSFSSSVNGIRNPIGGLTLVNDSGNNYLCGAYTGTGTNRGVFSLKISGGTVFLNGSFGSSFIPTGGRLINISDTLYGVCSAATGFATGGIYSFTASNIGSRTVISGSDFNATNGTLCTGLVTDGNNLFGLCLTGGTNTTGTIFNYNISSGLFTNIYSFPALTTIPNNSPVLSIASVNTQLILIPGIPTIYGTYQYGENGGGTIFSSPTSINPSTVYSFPGMNKISGSNFTTIGLVSDGNNFYGVTNNGGRNNTGTIFSMPIGGGSTKLLYSFVTSISPRGVLIFNTNKTILYGNTFFGGTGDNGSIYSYNIITNTFTILYSFITTSSIYNPSIGLTLGSLGAQVGLFGNGANNSGGGIFFYNSLNTSGTFSILHRFVIGTGTSPSGSMVLSPDSNTLYGVTTNDGSNTRGVIFACPITSTTIADTYTVLFNFSTLSTSIGRYDTANQSGGLTISSDGTTLYGATGLSSTNGFGAIFSISSSIVTAPNTPTLLYAFNSTGPYGYRPQNPITIKNNDIFVVTGAVNGVTATGTIIKIPITGTTTPTLIYIFNNNSNENTVRGGPILIGNSLYGQRTNSIYTFSSSLICFEESTHILSLINGEEVYVPIFQLTVDTLVKTSLNGYKKIVKIGSGCMVNNPDNPFTSLYLLPNGSEANQINNLMITGGHSLLKEMITLEQDKIQSRWWQSDKKFIEGLFRVLPFLDERCTQITERRKFNYYHFVLEGPDTRYGVYANGVLSETCVESNFDGCPLIEKY